MLTVQVPTRSKHVILIIFIYVLKYLHTASQGDFAPFFCKSRRHHPKYQQLTVEIENCHLFKVNEVRKKHICTNNM